jgi:hypothetical protein
MYAKSLEVATRKLFMTLRGFSLTQFIVPDFQLLKTDSDAHFKD